jgi:O-antigen/teichoic acid export membrane protein
LDIRGFFRVPSLLLRNTLWMAGGFGVRALFQFLYFVLLARALGPTEYGAFVGVLALVIFLSPFASWGSGNLLIKHVARDPSRFSERWGAALATTLLSGGLLVLLAVLITGLVFGWETALRLALPIALGEMLGTRLSDVASQAFQAVQRMQGTTAIWAGMALARLVGVLVLMALPGKASAFLWAWVYAVSGVGFGLLSVLWVNAALGRPRLSLRPMRGEWREGFYFAVSLSSQGAYNDMDKALLLRMVSDTVAGIYGAAYRLIDAAFIPVRALLYASYPRFFQEGGKGLASASLFARRLLLPALIMASGTTLALVALGPWLPRLLGKGFRASFEVLVWLLPVHFFRVLHYFPADALTGSGYQSLRTSVQLGVAGLNLLLNLWLIPLWGWKGAAVASWVSDGLLAVVLWGCVLVLSTKSQMPKKGVP